MATLNKILVKNHDATTSFEYEIKNTQHFKNFTIEAEISGLTYPASENDAELQLQDGEIPDNGTDTPQYQPIDAGFVKIADGSNRAKLRIVDLTAKNVKVSYVPNSVSGGTIDYISISFQR